jgi:predicted O-methyltransferase YrrM
MTEPRTTAQEIAAVACPILRDAYTSRVVHDRDGKPLDIGGGGIVPAHANALYRTILARKPAVVLEVGMAYGFSSMAIVSALKEAGGGRLISIDPVQSEMFKKVGCLNVERAGGGDIHELIEAPSYIALPNLLQQKRKIDFAYIDGCHTFDYVLLDFFYCDKLLNVGGVVAFNDSGYRAIHRVLNFVRTHRRYRQLDVGLRRDFAGRHPMFSVLKRLSGRSNEDRYFEKLEEWEPFWNFYARF